MSGLTELTGKVAVITGGASGIGLGMARRMKVAGMHVVIADVEQSALSAAARELGVMGVRTDVASLASVEALATQVVQAFGAVHVFLPLLRRNADGGHFVNTSSMAGLAAVPG